MTNIKSAHFIFLFSFIFLSSCALPFFAKKPPVFKLTGVSVDSLQALWDSKDQLHVVYSSSSTLYYVVLTKTQNEKNTPVIVAHDVLRRPGMLTFELDNRGQPHILYPSQSGLKYVYYLKAVFPLFKTVSRNWTTGLILDWSRFGPLRQWDMVVDAQNRIFILAGNPWQTLTLFTKDEARQWREERLVLPPNSILDYSLDCLDLDNDGQLGLHLVFSSEGSLWYGMRPNDQTMWVYYKAPVIDEEKITSCRLAPRANNIGEAHILSQGERQMSYAKRMGSSWQIDAVAFSSKRRVPTTRRQEDKARPLLNQLAFSKDVDGLKLAFCHDGRQTTGLNKNGRWQMVSQQRMDKTARRCWVAMDSHQTPWFFYTTQSGTFLTN